MEQGGLKRFPTSPPELCNHIHVLYEMSGQLAQGSGADFATSYRFFDFWLYVLRQLILNLYFP